MTILVMKLGIDRERLFKGGVKSIRRVRKRMGGWVSDWAY